MTKRTRAISLVKARLAGKSPITVIKPKSERKYTWYHLYILHTKQKGELAVSFPKFRRKVEKYVKTTKGITFLPPTVANDSGLLKLLDHILLVQGE